jgi:hypothetical protein
LLRTILNRLKLVKTGFSLLIINRLKTKMDVEIKGEKGALYVRSLNTLHGFNCFTDGDELILGVLRGSYKDPVDGWSSVHSELLSVLGNPNEFKGYKFISGSYGGDCLSLPLSLRHRAGAVIDTVRKLGYGVKLQTRLPMFYSAESWQTVPFSKENTEKLAVVEFQQAKTFGQKVMHVAYEPYASLWHDERLWCTQEGKQTALEIAKLLPNAVEKNRTPIFLRDNLLDPSKPTADYDFPTLFADHKQRIDVTSTTDLPCAAKTSVQVAPPGSVDDKRMAMFKVDSEREDMAKCVVCLDRDADTCVLPCMHRVVCVECSRKLANTPDAKHCVQCRIPISSVLDHVS